MDKIRGRKFETTQRSEQCCNISATVNKVPITRYKLDETDLVNGKVEYRIVA